MNLNSTNKCPLCAQQFNKTVNYPMNLLCSHLLCKVCVDAMYQSRRALKCKICRQLFQGQINEIATPGHDIIDKITSSLRAIDDLFDDQPQSIDHQHDNNRILSPLHPFQSPLKKNPIKRNNSFIMKGFQPNQEPQDYVRPNNSFFSTRDNKSPSHSISSSNLFSQSTIQSTVKAPIFSQNADKLIARMNDQRKLSYNGLINVTPRRAKTLKNSYFNSQGRPPLPKQLFQPNRKIFSQSRPNKFDPIFDQFANMSLRDSSRPSRSPNRLNRQQKSSPTYSSAQTFPSRTRPEFFPGFQEIKSQNCSRQECRQRRAQDINGFTAPFCSKNCQIIFYKGNTQKTNDHIYLYSQAISKRSCSPLSSGAASQKRGSRSPYRKSMSQPFSYITKKNIVQTQIGCYVECNDLNEQIVKCARSDCKNPANPNLTSKYNKYSFCGYRCMQMFEQRRQEEFYNSNIQLY